jgi:hypothetical protein
VIQPYFKAATQPGVIAIGVAQEFQSVLTAYDRSAKADEFKAAGTRYAFVKVVKIPPRCKTKLRTRLGMGVGGRCLGPSTALSDASRRKLRSSVSSRWRAW